MLHILSNTCFVFVIICNYPGGLHQIMYLGYLLTSSSDVMKLLPILSFCMII